ncbi:hypothetical protein D3C71_1116440 [compost metagenome]
MKKAVSTKEELQEMIEKFKKDVEEDGHADVSTEWVLTVMLDHPYSYNIKEIVAKLLAEHL